MEKQNQMETSSIMNHAVLLPNAAKKFGVAIMLLAFILLIVIKFSNIEMLPGQNELVKLFTGNAFILGLFLVAWARDKMENEKTILLRLKSLVFAFIMAVTYLLCKPLVDILLKDPIADLNGQELLLNMLLVYMAFYLLQKKASK